MSGPWVLSASDHGPMLVNRNDQCPVGDGRSFGVGWQILNHGKYDAEEIELIKRILSEPKSTRSDIAVAIDCGANIGVHSVEMGRVMTGWGRVIAFEPQRDLFYALCGNLTLNNIQNVDAHHGAVGAECDLMFMAVPNYNAVGSFGSLELKVSPNRDPEYIGQRVSYNKKDMRQVRVHSIDSFELERCDFIKIDVEGMEIEVLEGARNTLKEHHPILLVEWIKTTKESIRDFLTPFGYEFEDQGLNIFCKPPKGA